MDDLYFHGLLLICCITAQYSQKNLIPYCGKYLIAVVVVVVLYFWLFFFVFCICVCVCVCVDARWRIVRRPCGCIVA